MSINAAWIIKQNFVGICVLMELGENEMPLGVGVHTDSPHIDVRHAPFVIVEILDRKLHMVPIHSNLPVEMTVIVPVSCKCGFDLRNQEYYKKNYPNRWKKIAAKYPVVNTRVR